jgi:hypothetical protein
MGVRKVSFCGKCLLLCSVPEKLVDIDAYTGASLEEAVGWVLLKRTYH